MIILNFYVLKLQIKNNCILVLNYFFVFIEFSFWYLHLFVLILNYILIKKRNLWLNYTIISWFGMLFQCLFEIVPKFFWDRLFFKYFGTLFIIIRFNFFSLNSIIFFLHILFMILRVIVWFDEDIIAWNFSEVNI